jgi:hypothetical protein
VCVYCGFLGQLTTLSTACIWTRRSCIPTELWVCDDGIWPCLLHVSSP